ncbi:ATP synthase F1 subunit epsilon [bacterium]|nr:MAG: ATP synthase F1 subunit epsilon [bacterium]
MAREFILSIVAPDREVASESVVSVVAPGSEGYFGIQAGHLPMVAALRAGLLEYQDSRNQRQYIYIGGGFAEVRPDRVTVLADEARRATEITVEMAELDLERARKALRGEEGAGMNGQDAAEEVERAIQRLKAARLAR